MSKKITFFVLFFLPLIPLIAQISKVKNTIEQFWRIFILGGIALCLLALIIGGLKLVTSAGEPLKISEGKSWIIGGATGLVILLSGGIIYKGITGQTYLPWKNTFSKIQPVEPIQITSAGVYFCLKSHCEIMRINEKILPDIKKGGWILSLFSIPDGKNSPFLRDVYKKKGVIEFIIVHKGDTKYAVKVYSDPNYEGLYPWKPPFEEPGFYKVGVSTESFFIYQKGEWHGGEIILWRADVEGSGYYLIKALSEGQKYQCLELSRLNYTGEMDAEAKENCPGPLNFSSPIPCLGALEINGNYAVELIGKERGIFKRKKMKMLFPEDYQERKPLPSSWEGLHTLKICIYPIK